MTHLTSWTARLVDTIVFIKYTRLILTDYAFDVIDVGHFMDQRLSIFRIDESSILTY
jgi:hypothetical protein